MADSADEPGDAVIRQMVAGDRDAFRQVVVAFVNSLSRYVTRIVGNGMDADDIVQEAFLKLWTHRESFDPSRARLKTWLYRIAHNLAVDHLRRGRPEKPETAGQEAVETEAAETMKQTPTPDTALSDQRELEQLGRMLLMLPERQRSAIALCCLQGFSNRDAALILDLSVAALESLLSRGRKALRQMADEMTATAQATNQDINQATKQDTKRVQS